MRVVRADRCVIRQIDDALVIVRDLQFGFGDQHAAALDVADLADAKCRILAGNEGAGWRKHAFHSGARIRSAAHNLYRIAGPGIDHAHPQPVGIGVLLCFRDARDDKWREQLGLVLDAFDLKPDHGQLVSKLAERMMGIEMLLEPAESELHHRRNLTTCVITVRTPPGRREKEEAD